MALTRQKPSDEELHLIIAERLLQIVQGIVEERDYTSLIQTAETAIEMSSDILSPTDDDIRNLGGLYLHMGICQKYLKNFVASIKNVEIALSTYCRVQVKSDKHYSDLLFAREALAVIQARQGPEGERAALIILSEAIDAFTKINIPDDENYRKIASVYEWMAYLEPNSSEKMIECYVAAINFYEKIKLYNDGDIIRFVKSCKQLGIEYTKLTPKKYAEAIAIQKKGIEAAKLMKAQSDSLFRNLSALYYHLYLDIIASGDRVNHDCFQLLKNSLSNFQAITHKNDNDYEYAVEGCYMLAILSYETNKLLPIMPYIQQIFMLLAKISNTSSTHISCLKKTLTLIVETCTPMDPVFDLATSISGQISNPFYNVEKFIAYVKYILQSASWHDVIAVNEIVVNLITILLNAADNGALTNSNLQTMLLKGSDIRKLYELMRSELMTHPALKLHQQIEHSMPLMNAMVKKIQDLESAVKSLQQSISKRDRESDVDLPDQRANKKQDNATSQKLGLFAATSTWADQDIKPADPHQQLDAG